MQIVREMAGYSLGRADLVRRAMSKKKADVMAEERKNFIHGQTDENGNVVIDGAVRRGVPEAVANSIFDEMMDFAEYAFNKSHAAAYAHVTYQTAYLKCFYPAEYMAALLSSVLGAPDKVARYSVECKRMGIEILPPDINKSCSGFTVSDGNIRFGLAVVKNVGVGVIDAIVAEREKNGPFKNYDDFVKRTTYLNVTKRVHEYLIKAGAFDAMGETRGALLMAFEGMLLAAAEDKKRNVEGQMSLFGDSLEDTAKPASKVMPERPELPTKKLLALEKESVGFYLSGHPLDEHIEEASALSDYSIIELLEPDMSEVAPHDGMNLTLCGVVSFVREKLTKNGQRMAFVTIEDVTGSVECLIFPKVYELSKACLTEDAIVCVEGRLSMHEEEEPKIVVNRAQTLEEAQAEASTRTKTATPAKSEAADSRKLYLKFCLGKDYLLDRIKLVLASHRGNTPVCIHIEETRATAMAPNSLWVTPDDGLLGELHTILGKENVVLK